MSAPFLIGPNSITALALFFIVQMLFPLFKKWICFTDTTFQVKGQLFSSKKSRKKMYKKNNNYLLHKPKCGV